MAGKKGFGASLAYDAGAGAFTSIANITKLRPFDAKVDVIDTTAHDSPNETREKLSGLKDMGSVMADMNYDPAAATHTWLMTNLGVDKTFKITFPGGATATFSAFVKQVGPEIPHDNKMTCSAALEISGAITFA